MQRDLMSEEDHKNAANFRFNKKKDLKSPAEESQYLDAKLNIIQGYKPKKEEKSEKDFSKTPSDYESFYNSFSEINQFPRFMLPSVPTIIKVHENPKLR